MFELDQVDRQRHVNPAKGKANARVSEWIKRRYLPEDEEALVYLWCSSYLRSLEGIARGAHHERSEKRSDPAVRAASREMWAEQAPLVEVLLATSDVEVVCDPERVTASEAGPAVIWGFASTSGDVIHYVCVKRNVAKVPGEKPGDPTLGAEIVADLLGDRLKRPCTFTHELVEMRTMQCGVGLPRQWGWDSLWLPRRLVGLRQVADADGDVRWGRKAKAA